LKILKTLVSKKLTVRSLKLTF